MSMSGKSSRVFACILLVAATFGFALQARLAYADQINVRTLTLKSHTSSSDGGSTAGGVVDHQFNFTTSTTASLGSIRFEYCTTAGGACVMPTGLVTTAATLGSEDSVVYGFSLISTTNGSPYLTRTASSATAGALQYQLNSITNPTDENKAFYVRITTYTGTDGVTTPIDSGVVAASTATQIVLTGTMPESLQFCTGGTIGVTSLVPDCATATSGAITFNQLFSPTDTAWATSQMAASTNAGSGYAISVNGPTMTSGSNTITTMAAATTSVHGISQFGMNLKANTTPSITVSADVAPAAGAGGGTFKGQALTGYDTANTFKFVSGGVVADSASGGAGGTDAQIFTASYIVNVAGSQAAGSYTTTLTYICTATF